MAKRPINPFLGRWRITEMEVWDQDFVDLKGPAYIQFDRDNLSTFHFGVAQGHLDCRLETVNDEARIDFSWDGRDYNEPAMGRGWATIRDDQLFGRLYIYLGDDSWFKAEKT